MLGEEELLIERAVRDGAGHRAARRPAADLTGSGWLISQPPELAELVSPSLFAEGRVVVLERAQDAAQEIADAIVGYGKLPADGVVLVVLHNGGGRTKAGKALPAALRKAGADGHRVRRRSPSRADREAFVRNEIRRAGGKTDPAAVAALIDSVGLGPAGARLRGGAAGRRHRRQGRRGGGAPLPPRPRGRDRVRGRGEGDHRRP